MPAAHKPTAKTRKSVGIMLAAGCTHEIVAAVLDIDSDTLRKHYAFELEHGKGIALAKLAGSLYVRGIAGDTTAAIFWLKTRGQWREASQPQDDRRLVEFSRDELRAIVADYIRKQRAGAGGGAGAEERSGRAITAVR